MTMTIHAGYPGLLVPGLDHPSEPLTDIEVTLSEGEEVFKDTGRALDYDIPFKWAGN